MKICHYFEFESQISGGIAESVRHQRKALEMQDVSVTTEPTVDVDVVHLNVMGPQSVYLARKARKKGVPVVAHTHVTAEDFRRSFMFSNLLSYPLRPYLEYAYAAADHLLCPSEYTRTVMNDYVDVESTVVSNGVDMEKLDGWEDTDLRQQYLEQYGLESPVVFALGHVFQRKGLDTFVETAEQMPEATFSWFGPKHTGMKGRKTRKLMRTAPTNCVFTGYVEDIRGAFAAGDIFFFPTREENEGIALLEALACGKPVVVRDIPTYDDWLVHEENCLKADSVEGFQEQLQRVQEDTDLAEHIGKNAAELAQDYTLKSVGEKLLEVYRSVQ